MKDYQIVVKFNKNAQVCDYQFETTPKLNFGEIIRNKINHDMLTLTVKLINPSDQFLLRMTYLDDESGKYRIFLKNENVKTRIFDYQNAKADLGKLFAKRSFPFSKYTLIKSFSDFSKIIKLHRYSSHE